MKFELTISLGQVITLLTILGMGWRIDRVMMKYLFEHDLLILDYCERKGISITALPTRIKR